MYSAAESTRVQELSGLCELCNEEAAEIECASCGPVRVNKTDGGPLLLCVECSGGLHSKGVFTYHKLVKISRKLWLPVEEKLDLLKQKEAMLNDRRTKILEVTKRINENYDEAVEQLEITMKELQDAFVDKKRMLINNLTDVKDQQLLNCEHVNITCTALMDHVTKITSQANDCLTLEARQFAEQKTALLDEMTTVLEQSIPPLSSVTDITFSLADSVAMVKHQINDLLILPLLGKRVRAGEHVQGTVVNKITLQGLFWLRIMRRVSEGALMVISQSIRADIQRDIIKPITKATVGQLCCACFSDDNEWHRARVVSMVSTTHVKICYVDYGNYEECPVAHLRSLPDKYLFYPFQTIKCCITNDDGVEFSREARWLFNDRTKNKLIHLHIISELSSSSSDNNDINYLVTVKEPGEGGADISSLVLSKMKEEQKQPKHPIIHRDYRLTQQHKLAAAMHTPAEAPPIRPPLRLNTDAAEFVLDKQSSLQQPGVLQVSQSVFHNMVGVSVTSNVAKTPGEVKNATATVKNNVTATPKGKRGSATANPTANTVTTTPTGVIDSATSVNVTTTPTGSAKSVNVTTIPTEVVDNVTTTSTGRGDRVTTTPTGMVDDVTTTTGMADKVTTTPTGMVDNVTTTPAGMVDNATTTPTGMIGNVTTIPTGMTDNASAPDGNINTPTTVMENNITATTDNVIITPNGVGDVVTTDTQVTPTYPTSELKINAISKDDNVTTTGMGDKVNSKEDEDTTESVSVQQLEKLSTDNEALPCNSDGSGCHGNHDHLDSKDDGHDLEHVSTTPYTEDVSSHDAEVGVAGIYEIDNVAPPPNESLTAGATIEISVVSDLQSDGKFWSQLVADEETDEIFCDLMESLQLICAELHLSQKSPHGTPLVGSFCAALFSADNIWYRALVEQVTGDKLLVRYMDYGNAEMVSHGNIVPLVPKMKELPFQAFLCTISSDERNNFTTLMCERFSSLVKANDVFQAKVLSVKGQVVEVELSVELNDEVVNVNDDVYLTDFVSTESLLFSQATGAVDTKLTWTEQMEALDSPVTPTKDFPFQLTMSNPQQPLPREQSKSREKSKSHKSSPVCSVRKISNSSSRRMLRRQLSGEKPSGNKKQEKRSTVASEDIVPSSENWESEESLVGGADGNKENAQMLFIKGLPPTINVEVTKELFSKHGNVKDVKFDHSYPGRAWITMDVKGAKNAALQLRHHIMSGGDPRGLLITETDSYHPKRYKGQYKRY